MRELGWSQKYCLKDYFIDWMKRHLIIGFTTHGHTGEEVFLKQLHTASGADAD